MAATWYHGSIWLLCSTVDECEWLLCYLHLLFGLELGLTFRWRYWKEAHYVQTFTHITHKLILHWTSVQNKPLLKTSALASTSAIRLGSCFSSNYIWLLFPFACNVNKCLIILFWMIHHLLAILVLHFFDSFVGSHVDPPSRSSLLHPFGSTFGSGFDPSPCTIIVLYSGSSSFASAGISSFLLLGKVFLPVPLWSWWNLPCHVIWQIPLRRISLLFLVFEFSVQVLPFQVAISFHIICYFTLYLMSSQVYFQVSSFTLHCQSFMSRKIMTVHGTSFKINYPFESLIGEGIWCPIILVSFAIRPFFSSSCFWHCWTPLHHKFIWFTFGPSLILSKNGGNYLCLFHILINSQFLLLVPALIHVSISLLVHQLVQMTHHLVPVLVLQFLISLLVQLSTPNWFIQMIPKLVSVLVLHLMTCWLNVELLVHQLVQILHQLVPVLVLHIMMHCWSIHWYISWLKKLHIFF